MDSTCVKCGNNEFEMVERSLRNARFKFNLVQCSNCGGVVGVLEGVSIADMIVEQNKVIKEMAERMGIHVGRRLGFE